MSDLLQMRNAQAVRTDSVPMLAVDEFREAVICSVENGLRLSSFFGRAGKADKTVITAVLADDAGGELQVCSTETAESYESITPDCPQAHWFERELFEQWNIRPVGHPWLKPIRFQPSCNKSIAGQTPAGPVIGQADFFKVTGHEVHEVAVGPVHAGVIEPGHFRFQCRGEDVLHLEISLGYQHRGVARAMLGGPGKRSVHYAETLAGDTTIGHATAYCHLIEALSHCRSPVRADALRGVALELERLANHIGDLGALAGDVGFLPTMSYCGRIRGEALNLTALLCGNRFGRGMVRPGGVGFDVDDKRIDELVSRLETISKDTTVSANLLWETPSVQARFEGTGALSRELADEIGLVGPAARACGLERDIRHHHPAGIFRFAHIPLSAWDSGDVFARAYVRWLEIQRSLAFATEQLRSLPEDAILTEPGQPEANMLAVSMVEGWRGEICHVAITDGKGRFGAYHITDPSFHNWFGLAYALRNQPISDFPLCNKSFNLSYCGHDL